MKLLYFNGCILKIDLFERIERVQAQFLQIVYTVKNWVFHFIRDHTELIPSSIVINHSIETTVDILGGIFLVTLILTSKYLTLDATVRVHN